MKVYRTENVKHIIELRRRLSDLSFLKDSLSKNRHWKPMEKLTTLASYRREEEAIHAAIELLEVQDRIT